MHRWPKCPIGETIIIFLTVKRREIHKHVLNIPFFDHSGPGSRMGSYLTAPAEPETLIGLKRLSQCNSQASSGPFAGGVGNRYAVRYNDEARQRSAPRWCLAQRRAPEAPQANRRRARWFGRASLPKSAAADSACGLRWRARVFILRPKKKRCSSKWTASG